MIPAGAMPEFDSPAAARRACPPEKNQADGGNTWFGGGED